ncbi:MAG: hydroxymethylglutaryl-CoA reductase [Candidatus Dojkabacteria bacterium]|nr:MAG: hydroxymethylglutaryl-CoA reductase [Candidatus Dojkabacteria bacterium]
MAQLSSPKSASEIIPLQSFDTDVSPEESMINRRKYIEDLVEQDLASVSDISLEPGKLQKRNIENLIGSIQLPLGIAGPIKISGGNSNGSYFLPMATTEGTLVASTSRGAKAINMAGGASAHAKNNGMTRAPVFKLDSISDAEAFINWVHTNKILLQSESEKNSHYLKFKDITCYQLGREVWLRLSFYTGDAMGMNMATKAAQQICDYIQQHYPTARLVALSGNLCTDKKQAMINIINGRGISVQAEVKIPAEIVTKVLKTDIASIVEVNKVKVWHGSAYAGSNLGYNAHFANIVAAVFAATGQDLAHVVDASAGYCLMEEDNNNLYVSVTLPSVPAGDVGGGTSLPAQKTARDLMLTDISSKRTISTNRVLAFAEILACGVMAAEISLHAALAQGTLASAHEKFGRGGRHENK